MPLHVGIGSNDDPDYVEYIDLDNVIIRPPSHRSPRRSGGPVQIELAGPGAPEERWFFVEDKTIVVSLY